MPLSDRQISNLRPGEKPRKISDGGGLHLFLSPAGGKLWRLAYRFNGNQKLLSFGAYPSVSLAEAREKRDEAKKALAKGDDPAVLARQRKALSLEASANSFEVVASEFLEKNRREGKAEATLAKKRWLLSLALPDIGNRPISKLTAAEILVPLRRVEADGNYETAKRLRAFVGQVCRFAIATARAENDPTYGLKGALMSPKVTHMAAITDWSDCHGLFRAIWSYSGNIETRCALQLMAILYPRPGELRQAEWSEFDLDQRAWLIPAERMKMRKAHKKPLPDLAVSTLLELRNHTGNRQLLFPSVLKPTRPMSENTMNTALRRMGFTRSEMTSHGFRATASTLLNECGLWSADAIEAELGHAGADEVRRVYHRATYWDERVRMAEWWSEKVQSVRG